MIERWFPCADVTARSKSGWGSGRSEKTLFTWFATRPLAQARAAVICSLLEWPEAPAEQERLCDLVRRAMEGRDACHSELTEELARHHPDGASLADSFSGRAVIPLEAARLAGATQQGNGGRTPTRGSRRRARLPRCQKRGATRGGVG